MNVDAQEKIRGTRDVSSIAGIGGGDETALVFRSRCSIKRINVIDLISKYYASRPAKLCESCKYRSKSHFSTLRHPDRAKSP
jgi:hypothetical protein